MNKYRNIPTEHDEQVALFQWADLAKGEYPELALLFAIPNGGKRHIVTAMRLKDEGVKPGVPDVCLPVARGGYHGLFIEMKRTGGRVSPEQQKWLSALRKQRYQTHLCYDWGTAKDYILLYLMGKGE